MAISPSLQNILKNQTDLTDAELIGEIDFLLSPLSPLNPADSIVQTAMTLPAIPNESTDILAVSTEQAAEPTASILEELNQLFGLDDKSPEFPVLPLPPSSQARKMDDMPTGYSEWKTINHTPERHSMDLLNSGLQISNGYNPQHSPADFTNASQYQDNWDYPDQNLYASQIDPNLNYGQSYTQPPHSQLYPQYPNPYNDPGPQYPNPYNGPGPRYVHSCVYPDPESLPSYNYPDQVRRQHGYQPGPPPTFDPRASNGFNMPSRSQPRVVRPSRVPRPSLHRPMPLENKPRPYIPAAHPAENCRPQSNYPNPPRNRPRPRHQDIFQGSNPFSQSRFPSRQPNYRPNGPRPCLQEIPQGADPSSHIGYPPLKPNNPQNPSLSPQGASQEPNVAMDDESQYSSPEEDSDGLDSYSSVAKPIPYTPLTSPPEPWGPFTYNSYGELAPKKLFSVEEIFEYLYSHPSNNTAEGCKPLSGDLTLWLQRCPIRAVRRCGNPLAARCRFKDCPSKGNVIAEGEMRVAFDEYTKRIPTHNPQHMAGFVHLRCLEKFTIFPDICKNFNVLAEGRILPSEPRRRNTMILRSPAELLHAERFIDFCRREGRPPRTYSALGADDRTSNQRTLQEELDGFTDAQMNTTLKRRWEESGREGVDRGKRLNQKRKARTYVERKKRMHEERAEDELETQRRPRKRLRR